MVKDLDDRVYPIATNIARHIHRRFRNYTEYTDMQQEALLWFVKNKKKTAEYLDGGKHGERKLGLAVRRHCEREARKMKAQANGGEISDEFFYEISQISDMLPFLFNHQDWTEKPAALEQERVSGGGNPAEGWNWQAQMADVSRAVDQLGAEDQLVLRRYYKDDWNFRLIGKWLNLSESATRARIGQIWVRLLDELGGASPWK